MKRSSLLCKDLICGYSVVNSVQDRVRQEEQGKQRMVQYCLSAKAVPHKQ